LGFQAGALDLTWRINQYEDVLSSGRDLGLMEGRAGIAAAHARRSNTPGNHFLKHNRRNMK